MLGSMSDYKLLSLVFMVFFVIHCFCYGPLQAVGLLQIANVKWESSQYERVLFKIAGLFFVERAADVK